VAVAVARVIVMNAVNEDLNPHRELGAVVNPLTPTVAICVRLLKHPVPDRVKPLFAIFDIRAL